MQTESCVYGYIGGALTTPGVSGSVTKGYGEPSTGWSFAGQVNFGVAIQVGYSLKDGWFWEWGGGLPVGASLTGYYVFKPLCTPPSRSPKFPAPPSHASPSALVAGPDNADPVTLSGRKPEN
jgi:hypothetical protein